MSVFYGNVIAASGGNTSEASRLFENTSAATNTSAAAATLTGAEIAAGVILRSGPTAIFSDTTDTAANIIAALFGPNQSPGRIPIGVSLRLRIVNSSGFAQTLLAGTGVTLVGTMTLATATFRDFLVTITGVNTVTITNIGSGTD